MISPLTAQRFGFLSILVLLALLALVWFGAVPPSMYWSVFLIALALVLMRVTVRLVLQRDKRLHDGAGKGSGESRLKS